MKLLKYLKKGEHYEYRIKPTKGKKFLWRIDVWKYRNMIPLFCFTSYYFKTRDDAVNWREKQKEREKGA